MSFLLGKNDFLGQDQNHQGLNYVRELSPAEVLSFMFLYLALSQTWFLIFAIFCLVLLLSLTVIDR